MSRTKYRSVVFIGNGDQAEFDRWFVEYDEDPKQGFEYLLQWEHGDHVPEYDSPPWGMHDTIEYFNDGDNSYAVSYNWNLSYVSLTEILEECE